MNFSLKFSGLSYTLNGSFIHDLETSCPGKYWFTELCRFSKCWHISLQDIFFKIILIIPPNLMRENFSIEKLSSSWGWVQVFHNSNSLSKALTLSLATKIVSCFLWSDRLPLLILEKISTRYPTGLKDHSLPISHSFKQKWCSMKKSGQFGS